MAVETMESVETVECGGARCPRCMTYAQYRFLDHGDGILEYEVRCHACAHLHSEVTIGLPVDSSAA